MKPPYELLSAALIASFQVEDTLGGEEAQRLLEHSNDQFELATLPPNPSTPNSSVPPTRAPQEVPCG
jgi:hypothetical protein